MSRPYESKAPPSTTMVWPVIIDVPTHKKTITSAMSCGVQMRFRTARSAAPCLASFGQSRVHSESTTPGATALTRRLGNVAWRTSDVEAFLVQPVNSLSRTTRIDRKVVQCDGYAKSGEGFDGRQPDARPSAGNEDFLSVKV